MPRSTNTAGSSPPTPIAPDGTIAPGLTAAERRRLERCERVIERGIGSFLEVGRALMEVRDGLLYRETHAKFEDYCRERWQMHHDWARKHVASARVVAAIEAGSAASGADVPIELINSVYVARPLMTVYHEARRRAELRDGRGGHGGGLTADPDTPEIQERVAAAWQAALQRIGDQPITENSVRDALIDEGFLTPRRPRGRGLRRDIEVGAGFVELAAAEENVNVAFGQLVGQNLTVAEKRRTARKTAAIRRTLDRIDERIVGITPSFEDEVAEMTQNQGRS